MQLSDEIRKLPTVRAARKLLSLDILSERSGAVKMATLLVDNSLAFYISSLDAKEDKSKKGETATAVS